MYYFLKNAEGEFCTAVECLSETRRKRPDSYVSRGDFKSMEDAQRVAEAVNARLETERFLAVDRGRHVWPQWDVVRRPQPGDPISYAFNGDYYPDGFISRISASLRVIKSSTGKRYYRRGQSGVWLHSRMWVMVHGHVDRRNPEF